MSKQNTVGNISPTWCLYQTSTSYTWGMVSILIKGWLILFLSWGNQKWCLHVSLHQNWCWVFWLESNTAPEKMSFDGCGVSFGFSKIHADNWYTFNSAQHFECQGNIAGGNYTVIDRPGRDIFEFMRWTCAYSDSSERFETDVRSCSWALYRSDWYTYIYKGQTSQTTPLTMWS